MAIAPETNPLLITAAAFEVRVDPNAADRAACEASAENVIERHCTIEDAKGKVIPFALWPRRARDSRDAADRGQGIILGGRRLGMSSIVLAFALWLTIFHQDSPEPCCRFFFFL